MKSKPLTYTQKIALARINHPKHLDSLVHDQVHHVRESVAKRGNDKHRNQLVHDEDPNVRCHVAWHGNENHARALLKDKNKQVKRVAQNRLKEFQSKSRTNS